MMSWEHDVPYTCVSALFNFALNSKWKADKRGVRCIRLGPKENTLLSAGRSIKLWDLKTKETLKVKLCEKYNYNF